MTTATSPMLAVQKAVFDLLEADVELGTEVYDYVPEDAPHPYVVVGEAYETPDNIHGGFGRDTVVTLHVWTRSRGYLDGLTIQGRIIQILDHQPLLVAGFHHIATRFEFGQTLRDPDPELRHVVIRLRVVTEQEGE